jgi:hypothetical protein
MAADEIECADEATVAPAIAQAAFDPAHLAKLLAAVRHRERNSQLLSLSDAPYEAGLRRIERDLDNPQTPKARADHLCFVTVRGNKR